MSLDQKTPNGLDGDGDELAQLLLAGRMGRRRKIAGLALARKMMEAEDDDSEDVDDDDDEEDADDDDLEQVVVRGAASRSLIRRGVRKLIFSRLVRRELMRKQGSHQAQTVPTPEVSH